MNTFHLVLYGHVVCLDRLRKVSDAKRNKIVTTQNTDHYHTKEKTDGNKIKQNSDINLINIYIVRWNTRSGECGVRSVENAECRKCGV